MKMQAEIAQERNLRYEGRVLEVLVEDYEDGVYIGRTEYDSPEVDNEVLIKSSFKLEIGKWYDVKITGSGSYHLEGQVV